MLLLVMSNANISIDLAIKPLASQYLLLVLCNVQA